MPLIEGASISEVAKILEDSSANVGYANSLILAFALNNAFVMVRKADVEEARQG